MVLLVLQICTAAALAESAEPADALDGETSVPRVAVLDFANPDGSDWWAYQGSARVRDLLSEALATNAGLEVMGRESIDSKLQKERVVGVVGELSRASAVKTGRILGVRYLVTGVLGSYGTRGRSMLGLRTGRGFVAELSVRLIDSETGQIIWRDTGRSEAVRVDKAPEALEERVARDDAMFGLSLEPLVASLGAAMAAVEIPRISPESE